MVKKVFYLLTHWESWSGRTKYIPLSPVWLWYCLRAGSFWFFTPSNPTLTFGGFEGESKREMYDQLPPSSYPKTIYIAPSLSFTEVEQLFVAHHFSYPLAVKPDVGMMGFLFRKIDDAQAFRIYHEKMQFDYVMQELIKYPIEVSVFYCRFPNSRKGQITGFLKKEMMEVTGDGASTLEQLVLRHPKARFRIKELKAKHELMFGEVIPAGEPYRLSWAANLSRGARLTNLSHEIDGRLTKVFDDLSDYTKHFYYGRYDIKCRSIEDLKEGRHYSILEYNGSGAEPHHVYGSGYSLFQAYKILLYHWKLLYKISVYNHHNGIRYWKFREGLRFLAAARKHFKLLEKLDKDPANVL